MKFRNSRRGFTLAETIIVVFIMIVLGSLLLANTRQPSQKFELRRDAQTLVADIRRAQSLAVNAREVSSCPGGPDVPYFGFRIQPNSSQKTQYDIFADCNRNRRYNSSDPILNNIVLDNTFVDSVSNLRDGWLEIIYLPPNPDVQINRRSLNTFSIEICHLRETSNCLTIQGNIVGNVEIL